MSETLELDADFIDEIQKSEVGGKLSRCFACGTCSSGCPVHEQRPDFDPRKIIRMVLLGKKDELLDSGLIWLCSTCYTCRERCPQQVGCAEIIMLLRNLAVREGRVPEAYKMQMDALRQFGRVYEIEEFDNKKRKKLGLSDLELKAEIEPLIPSSEKRNSGAE